MVCRRLLTQVIKVFLCGSFALSCSAVELPRIALWKNGAPGSEARQGEPEKLEGSNVSNVHHPSITPFLPKKEVASGTAIIIAPGGGHRKLCLGHEGDSLAEWFASRGIAAFVLRYRLSREEGSPYTLLGHAMDDTRRAIRLVRFRAADWNVRPDRVGIVGFSAGGELAAYSAMKSDSGQTGATDPIERLGSRPDFQGLIYPGKSNTFTAHEGMPPVFIAFGYHDRQDIAVGMAEMYLKYKAAKVPCEMHVYANAGHGFGFRPGTKSGAGDWPIRLCEWLVDSDLLPRPSKH